MIVGNPSVFALESEIIGAYKSLSARALGLFVVHVRGRQFGIREPDATLMACSFDEVGRRISGRGSHTAPFAESEAGEIAGAYQRAIYTDTDENCLFFGLSLDEFTEVLNSSAIQWAPDGDEAFDDSSYILQFDFQNRVRLIAFRSCSDGLFDPPTLVDMWLPADDFYGVLRTWHDAFESEWEAMPKSDES